MFEFDLFFNGNWIGLSYGACNISALEYAKKFYSEQWHQHLSVKRKQAA